MRKALLTFVTAAAIALPVANATAAATKAKVVIRKFTGATYQADQYGSLQVVITVKKTTIGKKVTRKIKAVSVPVYPNHTARAERKDRSRLRRDVHERGLRQLAAVGDPQGP